MITCCKAVKGETGPQFFKGDLCIKGLETPNSMFWRSEQELLEGKNQTPDLILSGSGITYKLFTIFCHL